MLTPYFYNLLFLGYKIYCKCFVRTLSQEFMYEDLIHLRKILFEHYPGLTFGTLFYSIDQEDIFEQARVKIYSLHTYEEFYRLLDELLRKLKGDHLANNDSLFYIQKYFFSYSPLLRQFIYNVLLKNNSLKAIFINHFIVLKKKKYFTSPAIPLVYYNGSFYLEQDVYIGDIKLTAGKKLLKIDDIPIDKLLSRASMQLNKFDIKRKIFYGNFFSPFQDSFYIDIYKKKNKINFLFENNISIDSPAIITPKKTNKRFELPAIVLHLREILYIRIPIFKFNELNFFLSEIEKYKNAKINAVVLDIRLNPGGSSWFWHNILEQIIAHEYHWVQEFAFKKSSYMSQYIKNYNCCAQSFYSKQIIKQVEVRQIPILNNQEYLVATIEQTLIPKKTSLNLSVPIYVIAHDIYSSAGGLLSFARTASNFTIVGNANPIPLGQGIDPCFFSLKRSKYIFSFSPCLDITQVSVLSDMLHNKVDIEVKFQNIKDFLKYRNTLISKESGCLKEQYLKWLSSKDPYFKEILKQLYHAR